jgi:hypothetical protein
MIAVDFSKEMFRLFGQRIEGIATIRWFSRIRWIAVSIFQMIRIAADGTGPDARTR